MHGMDTVNQLERNEYRKKRDVKNFILFTTKHVLAKE